MSFDNRYPNRKDWRRPYTKSKRFDRSCRCHGGCPWCERNRKYTDIKRRQHANDDLNEYYKFA